MEQMFVDALQALLSKECTPQAVRDIEAGKSSKVLWQHLEHSGFLNALVSEELGGAGLGLPSLPGILEICGAHALPVPLAQTMWARAALLEAGVQPPNGRIALGSFTPTSDGSVRADIVHLGMTAEWVLGSLGTEWLMLPTKDARPSAAAHVLDAKYVWSVGKAEGRVRFPLNYSCIGIQACLVAPQIAGAAIDVLQRSVQYANERVQFGKPIAKLQAIQHQLAVMAEHAHAARMAARIGCQSEGLQPDWLRVAIAKGRTSEAALTVANLAHSIHGAIGFTAEFDLQILTRRLHAWRQTAGAESYWYDAAGDHLINQHKGLVLDCLRYTNAPV